MTKMMMAKRLVLSLVCALTLPLGALAQDNGAAGNAAGKYTDPATGYIYALDPNSQLPDALKPAPEPKKKGPVRSFLKGMGKELGTSFSDMGKDMVLMFSVQDIDPYDKHPDGKTPYELMRCRWMDGSEASIIQYPDGSLKVKGGFVDGTIAIPSNQRQYTIYYPNGVKGRMEKNSDGSAKIYRPDNTVTTMSKGASGALSISNDKMGYMGSATPDRDGLRYEMSSGSF